ncbi:OmpA family protein [Nitratifractor salsuginis]|uniref:Outer membrane porin F N-terminal domain-containing protein n=1 Tax=Nitratifractor salsuginis (strain DSM 16511 / JCM 12458 / E9I37-1) TaxID=749222 RepID=E6X020_NITSE|nr:OmpA family protein [Nitratifractor salsuginis]ADV46743.1 hypothetical protein Nitsa_1495 [Nitratifractor salsuginis DSM 16511]
MKKLGKIGLFLALASATSLSAGSTADHYRHLVGSGIFTSNNLYLQTGWYDLGSDGTGDKPDLSNANFVGSYYFGQLGDTWRPFVTGGFGFTDIEQDHVNLGSGDLGDVELDSTYLKLGGGINYNPTANLSLALGATGLWMHSDGDYNGNNADLRAYFGKDSDTSLYDLYGSANYHMEINGFKPYAELTLHYLNIDYDFDLSSTSGWNGDLAVGTYTPTLTTWMDLPVRARFYVSASFLDNDLSDVTGFDHAYHAGAGLLWKVGPMIHLFDDAFKDTELSFNLQGTTGDNDLKGWKASVGFMIAKF